MRSKRSHVTLLVTTAVSALILGVLTAASARASSITRASAASYESLMVQDGLEWLVLVFGVDRGGVIIPIDPPELSPVKPVLPLP
jgi:hypothetical protein